MSSAGTTRPTVSIVLPTHNRPEFLARAIRSVLAQSFGDYELIVVDDASAENPADLVAGFDDPRIRFMRHPENRGNAAARNTAIHHARGRFIAFLDDDDEWTPEKLELQVPILDASADDEALVYCARRLLSDDGVVGVDAPRKEGWVLDHLLPWGLMASSTVVLKAAVLDDVGLFDEDLHRGVDADLWRRIARSYRVLYIDRVLVNYYTGHDRVTDVMTEHQLRTDLGRWQKILREFAPELQTRPSAHAAVLRKLGERKVRLGEASTGRGFLIRSFRLQPRPDTLGMVAASLLGRRGIEGFLRFKERVMRRVRPLLRGRGDWRRSRYVSRG